MIVLSPARDLALPHTKQLRKRTLLTDEVLTASLGPPPTYMLHRQLQLPLHSSPRIKLTMNVNFHLPYPHQICIAPGNSTVSFCWVVVFRSKIQRADPRPLQAIPGQHGLHALFLLPAHPSASSRFLSPPAVVMLLVETLGSERWLGEQSCTEGGKCCMHDALMASNCGLGDEE